jgi:hypothetical protein
MKGKNHGAHQQILHYSEEFIEHKRLTTWAAYHTPWTSLRPSEFRSYTYQQSVSTGMFEARRNCTRATTIIQIQRQNLILKLCASLYSYY